jgi:uncharacterized protein YndB with AHSA1/START domain
MEVPSVNHSTFVINRSYPTTVERVFAAFANPAKKRRWFVEGPHKEIDQYQMDFQVGGTELVRYHYVQGSPYPDAPFVNTGSFQDIVSNRRIVHASTMSLNGKCFSASLITFEFLPSDAGVNLVFTFQGAFFEGSDGPQIREMGWNKLLDQLAEDLTIQDTIAPEAIPATV